MTVNASRLPSKDRYTRPQIIDREGRFVIEEKTTLPDSFEEGEILNFNGMLFVATSTTTLFPVGMNLTQVEAGDSAYTVLRSDALIQITTNSGTAPTLTLPEAADTPGQTLTFSFVSDGGQSVTINRTGSDTIDDSGDTGNTSIAMQDAGDVIQIMAVGDNQWLVIKNLGCTLT